MSGHPRHVRVAPADGDAHAGVGVGDVAHLVGVSELRAYVERQLAATAVSTPQPLSPYLFKPEVVARFRKRLQGALVAKDAGIAREYLRRLVERIVITDGDVVVEGKTAAAVALMAESARR